MSKDASELFLHCLFLNIFNVYVNSIITHNIIIQEKRFFHNCPLDNPIVSLRMIRK